MAFWIVKGQKYKCSNCHTTFDSGFYDMDEEPTCPCCGVIIEGEHRNEKVHNVRKCKV